MIKKIILALFLFIILAIIGLFVYVQTLRPDYSGDLSMHGLDAKVEVHYDTYGIPHIYAETDNDAWQALGYVHAQDRLWQMELLRRIGAGRLSELFGNNTLKTDKFFRTLGIDAYSSKSAARFSANSPPAVQDKVHAYLTGVNHFIDHGPTPIEMHLVGANKSHFDVQDVYNVIGYMAFSFGIAHRTEPIITYIQDRFGSEYLQDMDIDIDTTKEIIPSYPISDLNDLSSYMGDILNDWPVPSFMGSNSWVLGPSKTSTGKVIFANDPHMKFGQPAVWYEAHIETPTTSLYGYFLGGSPFPQMGHTRTMATGLTMLLNDDTDLFAEEVKDGKFKYNDEWLPLITRSDTIPLRSGDDHIFEIKETAHGPLINNVVDGLNSSAPVSIWWSYINNANYTLEGAHDLLRASSVTDIPAAASKIHAPGLNIMYGDSEDNIAWWGTAKLVKRNKSKSSKLILDGTTNADDPIGYYDFDENPTSTNPNSGYVYSANNQTISRNGIYHEGYYVPEDRGRKIVSLLETKNDWSVDDVKEMMLNFNSLVAVENIKMLSEILEGVELSDNEVELMQTLNQWGGTFDPKSHASTIYVKLITELSHQIFADELGKKRLELFLGTPMYKKSFVKILANRESKFWDKISTKDKEETSAQIIKESLRETQSKLSAQLGSEKSAWQWDKVHSLEHEHPLGQVSGLKKFFNVGPFPIGGWEEVINNMHTDFADDGVYKVLAGPSTRRIVDFSDIENNSWSISPTGQSGNPLSPHYKDQAEMFINGEFRKQKMNKKEILKETQNTLTLLPK